MNFFKIIFKVLLCTFLFNVSVANYSFAGKDGEKTGTTRKPIMNPKKPEHPVVKVTKGIGKYVSFPLWWKNIKNVVGWTGVVGCTAYGTYFLAKGGYKGYKLYSHCSNNTCELNNEYYEPLGVVLQTLALGAFLYVLTIKCFGPCKKRKTSQQRMVDSLSSIADSLGTLAGNKKKK